MARLFDADPVTKTRSFFHWNEAEEAAHIETLQDVTEVVEDNKGLYNLHDERAPWKGDGMHKVASIPLNVYADLQRQGIVDDPEAFRRWLNDRDNLVFRTRPGRV